MTNEKKNWVRPDVKTISAGAAEGSIGTTPDSNPANPDQGS